MLAVSNALRRSLVDAYLTTSADLVRRKLRGRSGPRDFSRVVVVAALARNNGISSGARLQCAALRTLGIDAELLDATPALRNPFFRADHRPGSAYIFHSGGPQTASLISGVLPHAVDAYRIGYWAWELPDPPRDWLGYDRNLAEIWTPSAFSQASLRRIVSCPIQVVPHVIPAETRRTRDDRAPFTVLAMADGRSSWSRKNPDGAVHAFRAAFGTSPDMRLRLKLSGTDDDIGMLQAAWGEVLPAGNIEIIRGYLEPAALATLYREADVFLSLHRAEGYGLPLNEAMAHGVPVVATGWSGNLDFMSAEDSGLVPYGLVPVEDASGIYGASTWAEPDIAAAAQALRRLANDRDHYDRIAAAAHRRVCAARPAFPLSGPVPGLLSGMTGAREAVTA